MNWKPVFILNIWKAIIGILIFILFFFIIDMYTHFPYANPPSIYVLYFVVEPIFLIDSIYLIISIIITILTKIREQKIFWRNWPNWLKGMVFGPFYLFIGTIVSYMLFLIGELIPLDITKYITLFPFEVIYNLLVIPGVLIVRILQIHLVNSYSYIYFDWRIYLFSLIAWSILSLGLSFIYKFASQRIKTNPLSKYPYWVRGVMISILILLILELIASIFFFSQVCTRAYCGDEFLLPVEPIILMIKYTFVGYFMAFISMIWPFSYIRDYLLFLLYPLLGSLIAIVYGILKKKK